MALSLTYLDGHICATADAALPVHDLAVVRGYGVFDFCRTYGKRPFHLAAHLARLRRSAAVIGLGVPWDDAHITGVIHDLLARGDAPEYTVRVIVTGGDAPDSITPLDAPRLLIIAEPVRPPNAALYTDGAAATTIAMTRAFPQAKTLNYLEAIVALRQARAAGAVEALYVGADGCVCEGTTTNVFAHSAGRWATPAAGMLPGITRGVVLEMLADQVEARALPLAELARADEIVLTASNKQILPIVTLDGAPVGTGRVGPHARALMTAWAALTAAWAGEA